MTRWWGGGSALLLAALLTAACMKSIEFDHPPVGGGGGGGGNGVGGGFGNGGDGFGDGGISDAGGDVRLHCLSGQPVTVSWSPESPSIMFALDRSPTMRMPLDGTTSRYQITRDAINAALGSYQQVATFGYVEFPGDSGDSSCGDCCFGGFVPLIAPSNNSNNSAESSISPMMTKCWNPSMQQYNCIGSSESPSGQALQKIARTFQHTPTIAGQLYALLMTDGPPSCPLFSSSTPMEACDDAASQISDMNIGPPRIGTFVVALGDVDVSNVQCFNNLASAGGHASGGPTFYYPANTEALVRSQIDKIVTSTICRLNISPQQGALDPNPARLDVQVRGQSIPNMDPTNGYAINGTQIDFVGAACTTLIGGLKSSRVTVKGCPDPRSPSFPSPAR